MQWAEGDKQCNRLKLADMLAKPHQRLTKYPLLLKTILKKTDEPAAKDCLLSMVREPHDVFDFIGVFLNNLLSLVNVCVFAAQVASVENFINSVDSQMLQRQEQQKLAAISARVESYEAVEGGSEEVERVSTASYIFQQDVINKIVDDPIPKQNIKVWNSSIARS